MNQTRLRILLVDDDEDDYILTHAVLNEFYGDQIDVEWISSYEPAKEALLSGRHELCLLDYHLGARTGLELLRETTSKGCTTPVILLTGNDDWQTDVEAMQAGAADYLIKGQFGTCLLERSIRYARGFAAQRQHTLEALRTSEERYALAVRGANDGLWDWDLTTNRIYFAPRWKSMLGYAEEQIGDNPEEWFSRLHRMDVERVKAEVEAHLAGRSSHLETECRILHDDGSYRWFLTRGLAVRDQHGRAVRIAGSQSDITPRKVIEDRLQHNAFHDSLTGLPNRALLMDRLGQAVARTKRRPDCRFGVLFLDMDGFKFVNDSLGHQMGDQLLIAISRRLERCLRDGDTVARLGGDEFIILMHDVADSHDVLALADRVLECLQNAFSLDGHELVMTASIGIALSSTGIDSADDVVRSADIAMYRAKSRGKSGYVVFDQAMHAEAVTRLQLNTDLRQATARGELKLFYQPIVALKSGSIRGFEALLRWYHPERGLVSPIDFVPLAEESKLILPIGMWVIRTAAEQLRTWQERFRTPVPLSMSVNMSCRQFSQPDLVYQIERAILDTGLDARCLKMEITESSIIEHVETASAVLSKLKGLGVKLALDDFGKGYSSLSYLHQFPFDTLKLDRSFISGSGPRCEHMEIVRTMITLADVLGLDVVAEGVETALQFAQLRDLGCQFGQGYFFSRPLTAEAAGALLEEPPDWLESITDSARAGTRHLAEHVQTAGQGRVVDSV
jgi:diguanylate cyclase (GGDEF)-like protein/PAS domain S-box-containing protein